MVTCVFPALLFVEHSLGCFFNEKSRNAGVGLFLYKFDENLAQSPQCEFCSSEEIQSNTMSLIEPVLAAD